jgi:hypothetical protein
LIGQLTADRNALARIEADSTKDRLIWWLCKCGARRALGFNLNTKAFKTASECRECKSQEEISLHVSEVEERFGAQLLPRVTLDNLLDYTAVKRSLGVSYTGSAEHIVEAKLIADSLEIPAGPDIVWRPKLSISNIGSRDHVSHEQSLALSHIESGRSSFALYYNIFGGQDTFWAQLVEKVSSLRNLNSPLLFTI